MQKIFKITVFSTIVLSACVPARKDKEARQVKEQPNILLFFTDDNDFSYWGFGGGPDLSPHIDGIAEAGITASQFYCTAPVCTPSRYSLHTGKFAGRCRDRAFVQENPLDKPYSITWNTNLDPQQETTLGELLQQAGYYTGFVGKWHLGFDYGPYDFDPEADPSDPGVDAKLKACQQDLVEMIKEGGYDYASSITAFNNDWHPVKAVNVHNLEWYARGALDFLDEAQEQDRPFFLVVNITTHHGPCHTESIESPVGLTQAGYVEGLENVMPERSTIYERIEEKGYRVDFKTAGTVWTDDLVGSVLQKLEDMEVTDQTAVVFTTDHNRFDGKATCYQGGVHIPFVMQYPGSIPAGSETGVRFMIPDLLPTFVNIAGSHLPEEVDMDGKNAAPILRDPTDTAMIHEDLYFEFGYTRGILYKNWKYIALRYPDELIRNMKEGKVSRAYGNRGTLSVEPSFERYPHYFDPDQLFNIKKDPGEQHNLAYDPEYKEILEMMQTRLKEYLQDFEHPFPLDKVDPFYFTEEFKELTEKAREVDMNRFDWYRKGCY